MTCSDNRESSLNLGSSSDISIFWKFAVQIFRFIEGLASNALVISLKSCPDQCKCNVHSGLNRIRHCGNKSYLCLEVLVPSLSPTSADDSSGQFSPSPRFPLVRQTKHPPTSREHRRPYASTLAVEALGPGQAFNCLRRPNTTLLRAPRNVRL